MTIVKKEISMLKGGKTKEYDVILEPIPHVQLHQSTDLQGWYKSKHVDRGERPRVCYTDHLLTKPYGGRCFMNCAPCYVNNGVRGYRAAGYSTVDKSYPERIKKQLSKMYVAFPAYISSLTEVFNPLEDIYHNTEKTFKVFDDLGLPIGCITRCLLPDWAIEILKHNPWSYVQWSIITSNQEHMNKLCPNMPKLDDLFKHISLVSKEGIDTQFFAAPVLPGISSEEELLDLVRICKQVGGTHIVWTIMEAFTPIKKNVLTRLKILFKEEEVKKVERLWNEIIGHTWKYNTSFRHQLFKKILEETIKVGITNGLCFEYEKINGEPVDMSPKYTSARSCHGRGSPVYYRDKLTEPFKPLENCYRACLYCEEKGNKICNNETLLQAKALRTSDFRKLRIISG